MSRTNVFILRREPFLRWPLVMYSWKDFSNLGMRIRPQRLATPPHLEHFDMTRLYPLPACGSAVNLRWAP
jgi:hypothetical protein